MNSSVASVNLTIQGKKAVEIYYVLRAYLQRMDMHIGSNYYLKCLDSWCNINMTNTIAPEILLESKCDVETAIIIVLSLILSVVLTASIIIRYCSTTNHLNIKKQNDFVMPSYGTKKLNAQQHYSTFLVQTV